MNSILRRRRALMVAKEDTSTPISALEAGTGIKFGNAEFIIVSKFDDYSVILRINIITGKKFYNESVTKVDYDGCVVDTYLTGTWYNAFPQNMQNYMVDTSFSYTVNDNGTTSTKSIQRKIISPSKTNMEGSTWLNSLKAYYGTTDANTARIAKDSTNTAKKYWLRDAYTGATNRAQVITETGTVNYQLVTNTNTIRPAIALSKNTPFALVDGIWTFVG